MGYKIVEENVATEKNAEKEELKVPKKIYKYSEAESKKLEEKLATGSTTAAKKTVLGLHFHN